jgi:hypothetical protein
MAAECAASALDVVTLVCSMTPDMGIVVAMTSIDVVGI